MKLTVKLGAVAAMAALTAAAPALAAKPPHPSHPTTGADTSPSKSHRCAVHSVAYIASGTLVSWSATANADGTYSGQIEVDIRQANHHAGASRGDQTLTLSDARVGFGKGAATPAGGDRVKLIGRIAVVGKKCTSQTGAGTVSIGRLFVKTVKGSGGN